MNSYCKLLHSISKSSKIGPLKGLAFNHPSAQTEDLYIKSINTTVDQYRVFLDQERTGSLVLPNCDLDSGNVTKAGEYSLTDDTHAKLLVQLSGGKFDLTSPELRANLLDFYSNLSVPIATKTKQSDWQSVLTGLEQLRLIIPATTAAHESAQ